ncbi:MAG: type VI secretion system tip protein VgrG [Polyangiaceae bacterium]|nr:type VI secretion system tip protein VgrG [Polyangiaceae bacterium]
MSTRTVDIDLAIPVAEAFRIVAARVVEGISKLTHVEVEIASHDAIDFSGAVNKDAALAIRLDGVPARSWSARLSEARFAGVEEGAMRYKLDFHPRLWFLRHTKNTRKFRNMSAKDIITKVLAEGQVPFEWKATRTPPVRKYCVQYRESNLAFVLRLLEFEGIYYTFTNDDVLEFGDQSASADFVEGAPHYELLDASGALDRDELGIHEWKRRTRVASGKASVNDHNWKKPRLDLLTSKAADLDTELETYDYPTGFRNPKDGEYLAQIRLEGQRVPARTVSGKGNVPTFAPLRKLSFGDKGGFGFGGEHLLVEVHHHHHNAIYQSVLTLPTGRIYENSFVAVPSDVPFRPAWVTPRPTIEGTHTAMVRGPAGAEIHTDKYGRFRAQFHWDREAKGTDEDSRWVRPLQESATSMVLARVGWEMSIAYIDGDPDRPVGIARNINGIMVPTYGQPAQKSVMTIKTPTSPKNGGYNELRLDDNAGSQSFFVRAERDLVGVVKHDKTERIGNNETHSVSVHMNRAIEHDQTVAIGANSKTSVGHDYRLEVKANRSITVGGNETIEVGASAGSSIFNNDTETVGSVRLTQAGLTTEGSINRRTEKTVSRTVGGAFIAVTNENVQTQVQKNYVDIIGGVKLTMTKNGSISQVVSGEKKLFVGGAILRQSGEDMGTGAEKTQVNVAGMADLRSAERVEYRGKVVKLEAMSSLTFKGPGMEMSLTPGKTTLKGIVLLQPGDKLITTGGPDNITK